MQRIPVRDDFQVTPRSPTTPTTTEIKLIQIISTKSQNETERFFNMPTDLMNIFYY